MLEYWLHEVIPHFIQLHLYLAYSQLCIKIGGCYSLLHKWSWSGATIPKKEHFLQLCYSKSNDQWWRKSLLKQAICYLQRYGVKHKVAKPYHTQISGQVKLANREIKGILMKDINFNRKDWSFKLNDVLWTYKITHKTNLGMSSHRAIYGKRCHLLVEIEHKAY